MSTDLLKKRVKLWAVPALVTVATIGCALSVNSQPAPGNMVFKSGGPHGMHMMPPFTVAFPGPGMMPPPPPPLSMEIGMLINSEDIDLSDEQISKLADIKRESHKNIEPVMSKLHSAERDYRDALISGKDVSGLKEDILTSKKNLDSAMLDSAQNMVNVLTAEQKKKLKLALDKREVFPFHGPKPPHPKECKPTK
ncbi:MAG: Spy/CpxP family protein refolding chaperone [Cyanobacteria bacterium TGS_CYA1]|nr:Spy/CpxP family protein refolding chaperone [Cyanobacteria bacterium TGS_CYA1]